MQLNEKPTTWGLGSLADHLMIQRARRTVVPSAGLWLAYGVMTLGVVSGALLCLSVFIP